MKKIIAISGIVLFLGSILIAKILKKQELAANALYDQKTGFGVISSDIAPCSWTSNAPEKVISENKTTAIVIETKSSKESECESTLSIQAPGFDISPSRDTQTVNLPSDKSGSISWILSPRKTGTYQVSITDGIDAKIYGVTVNNIFGLSAVQAKSASFLGSLFGPMLTVPWWWDRFRKKKEDKAPE